MKNGFKYDVDAIRAQFPACKLEIAGAPIAYLDGPGGTQVPQPVLDAMVGYLAVRCRRWASAWPPPRTASTWP